MASAVPPEIENLGNHRWTIVLRPLRQPFVNFVLGAMGVFSVCGVIALAVSGFPAEPTLAGKAVAVVGLLAVAGAAALAFAWCVAGREILRVDQDVLRIELLIANRVILSREYARSAIRHMRFRIRARYRSPPHQTLVFDVEDGKTVELACELTQAQVDDFLRGPLSRFSQDKRAQ